MANRFIGGVLSSRPQANTPFSSRATTGTYFNSAGTMVTAPVNQPRLNYNFVGSAWTLPTVLIEPASTNIITYSEQINNAAWSKIAEGSRTGVTANAATAPDGNTTADLVYVYNGITSVSGGAYWPYTFTNGVTYTWSCFFKYVGYQYVYMGTDNNNASCVWFDLSAGTVGSTSTGFRGTITNVGNSWYRCAVTFTFASASMGNAGPIMGCANVNGTTTLTQAGTGSTGVYMWGAQLEVNSLGATSYIPTVASTVTRAADIVGPGTSGIFGLEDRQNTTAIDDQSTVTSFTSTGSTTWTAPADVTSVEVLVVAGGGAGGAGSGAIGGGGGGGGGILYNTNYTVVPGTTYPVVVGAGGVGASRAKGTNGVNSQFGGLIALGGGAGASDGSVLSVGAPGGSGGGGSGRSGIGGGGTAGQGNPGSNGATSAYYAGGAGGGAGGPATPFSGSVAGSGGPGLYFNISGTSTAYGGGGGGGGSTYSSVSTGGVGGVGGGGSGTSNSTNGTAGTVNTGGGGGASGWNTDSGTSFGGAGGSGIVIVKYKRTPRQLASTSNAAIVVQKFNSTNLWTVPTGVTSVEALVVAGGGGGGNGTAGGGGGAGGVVYSSSLAVTPGSTYTIGVGGGGVGGLSTGGPAYNGFGSGIGTGTELITNGNAFTVTTGWTATTATLSVPSTGIFRITPNAGVNGTASQSITTVNGVTYVAVVKVISDITKNFRLRIGTTQVGSEINDGCWADRTKDTSDNGVSGTGFYSQTFTATGSTTWINIQIGGGTQQATDFSYISVRQATLPAFGGGYGGSESSTVGWRTGGNGGSGGGSTYNGSGAGTGVAGQGNAGGAGTSGGSNWTGGGGGGAGSAGTNALQFYPGYGGAGVAYSITGNLEYYGGGGGGASQNSGGGTVYKGLGGIGGGGIGFADQTGSTVGTGGNGAPNTGGGGGGQADVPGSENSGHGGSGVVILRYRVPQVVTFLDSGSWTCPAGVTSVQALIVAGGGAGGSDLGGGGGAGGVVYNNSIPVTPGVTYPIVVGQGGTTTADAGNNGQNSNFANIIAVGGGGGGSGVATNAGRAGGSGGGARVNRTSMPGGTGTYGQGNAGGGALNLTAGSGYGASGGGGGAGGVGAAGSQNAEGSAGTGDGGIGLAFSISGSSTYYGGGGGACSVLGTSYIPAGGLGGGAAGIRAGSSTPGNNATANTGGGGGGGGNGYTGATGSQGGSGIVIIRWYGA